jgi:hypothetical protein
MARDLLSTLAHRPIDQLTQARFDFCDFPGGHAAPDLSIEIRLVM